ncbi:MAG: hypothetical protein D4S02_16975 [Rhodocyclaceae bacterium]|nr:MAG: hypothetical protein D4S02_16975 [Rhodocyclaceae bacterium]
MKQLWLVLLVAGGMAQAQSRPQLDDVTASHHSVVDYLSDPADTAAAPWQPAVLESPANWPADFVVAPDGGGTHRSLQAAIDAVPALGTASRRYYIRIKAGVYREQVCAVGKGPITLYGETTDAKAVRLVHGHYNAQAKRSGIDAANACVPDQSAASYGTAGSATAALFGNDFQLAHLTVANDAMDGVLAGTGYPPGAGESGGAQAVALMVQGDRIQIENVRLLGHQDTLYVRASAPGATARIFVHRSLIAGDVDFIFGNATLVIDDCTILSRAGRRTPGNGGHVLAPSTAFDTRLGLLVSRSRFVADDGVCAGSISLGRAWDHGVAHGAWKAGVSPNGAAVVRDSIIGPHLGPWAASTSRRPFSATGEQANRLFEYRNLPPFPAVAPPPADEGKAERVNIARAILPDNDGWAAAQGGTTGGADASPADVFEVNNRSELVAALAGPSRPRIVKIHGRIDLGLDHLGRPLGYADYRDPEFDFVAFVRTYDPAVWGRQSPDGPLERARRRSARRQAAQVVIRVPSNTTLLGIGSPAGFRHGMILLENVNNVIVRNLSFSDAHDFFPLWDPKDNARGEWNSEYDNLSLRNATHVWVDHCTFDDQSPLHQPPLTALGRPMEHHDGLLDITRGSDLVTVSWNHFRRHDKTTLVGGSDHQADDAGKLRVTFHHNFWEQVKERAPRVRFGQVHVYNNLYVAGNDPAYPFGYSIGIGVHSRVVSENNVWETPAAIQARQLLHLWKGDTFVDSGSLLNGRPVDLLGALREANPGVSIAAEVGWRPQHALPLDAAELVVKKVRAGAGAGRL